MQRAGHANFSATQAYIREAETLGENVGEPLGPLPESLLEAEDAPKSAPAAGHLPSQLPGGAFFGVSFYGSSLFSAGLMSVPKGIRTPVTALKGPCPGPG